ncbi:MAG: MmcQ/YjbR family DNA-binding protein [Hydrogeniiclostridium mannosilyticum]
MTIDQLIAYCLQKPGAYIDHPFGPESTVLKVEKRIFAQCFVLKGQDSATLNCDRMTGQFYRDMFPGVIVRGYHCPPVQQPYFNTFPLDGSVPDDLIFEMVKHSYAIVVGKLPKYIQKRLTGGI